MTNLVTIQNNRATTTSTSIAKSFGKEHKDVLEAIRNLIVDLPEEFSRRNFPLSSKTIVMPNGGKRNYPAYEMTRDGFTLLAMGFTGKKALEWKLKYIMAFNAMETKLATPAIEVRSYTRKLPTTRVKKELVLSDKGMAAIGGMVKRCAAVGVKEAINCGSLPLLENQGVVAVPEPVFRYIHTELGNLDPTINKLSQFITACVKQAFKEMTH